MDGKLKKIINLMIFTRYCLFYILIFHRHTNLDGSDDVFIGTIPLESVQSSVLPPLDLMSEPPAYNSLANLLIPTSDDYLNTGM